MKSLMTRVELVGGPRDGERRVIERAASCVRFTVTAGRGKPRAVVMYRRRPGGRGVNGVVYYDYLPSLAA